MTTPDYVSTKYSADSTALRRAKVDRSGSLRMEYFTVTLTAVISATKIVGLVPFQKGARLVYGATVLHVADLDTATNVTIDVGYTYDDAVTYTTVDDAFLDSSTAPQAGGIMTMANKTGLAWQAAAPGWITATLNADTTTTGVLQGQVTLTYDQ